MAGAHFDITGNPAGLLAAAQQSSQALANMQQYADRAGMSIDQAMGNAKRFAGTLAGFAGLSMGAVGLVNQIKSIRTEFQNTEAMFKVFLKSGEAAEAFMQRMQSYAFNNVFDLSRLSQSAAQLLAYGTSVDDVIDKLDNLSNIAAGTNKPLEELVSVYNRVKSTNTIDSRTEMSLKNMGINIREILEQSRELDKGSLSNAKLRFQELDEAIQAATHNGGLYEGMMEEKMKTLGDKVGLLQDQVQNTLNEIGKDIQEPFGEAIENIAGIVEEIKEPLSAAVNAGVEGVKFLTEHWKGIISVLALVAAQYGTLKAAMTMDKSFNNAERLQKLQMEAEKLRELQREYLKLRETELKGQIDKINSKDDKNSDDLKALIDKEQELNEIQSNLESIKADNSLSAKDKYDQLNQAYSQYVDGLDTYINANSAFVAQLVKDAQLEVDTIDEQLKAQLKKDNMYDEEMKSSFDAIEAAKNRRDAAEENISSITSEINAIQEKIKAKQSEFENVDSEMAELSIKQEELSTLAIEHNTAVTEINSQREKINTTITQSSTSSKKANALAQKSNALQTNVANAALTKNQLALAKSSIATKIHTTCLRIQQAVIRQATQAWKALTMSMATNPLGWVMMAVEGLAALGTWIYKVATAETSAEKQQKALNEALADGESKAQSETWSLDLLITRLKNVEKGSQEYLKIKNELINQYSKYGAFVRDEIDQIIEQGDAYERLKILIHEAAMERAKQSYAGDLQNEVQEGGKKVFEKILGAKDFYTYSYNGGQSAQKHKASDEDAQQIQATLMSFFTNDLPKMENLSEASSKDITDAFFDALEKNMGERAKDFKGDTSIKTILKKMTDYANDNGEKIVQLNKLDNLFGKNDTKADEKQSDPTTKSDKEDSYRNAFADMQQAYDNYVANATEDNKKLYDDAVKTADDIKKELEKIYGSVDNSLTLGDAQKEQNELQGSIAALNQQIQSQVDMLSRANKGELEMDEEARKATEESLTQNRAQLQLDQMRLKTVQNTIKEITSADASAIIPKELKDGSLADPLQYAIDKEAELEKKIQELKNKMADPNWQWNQEDAIAMGNLQTEQAGYQAYLKQTIGFTDVAKKGQQELQNAINNTTKILNSQIKARRLQIAANTKQQIKEENQSYQKSLDGRVATNQEKAAHAQRIKNIKLQAKIDTEELDREWNEWKRNFERQTLQIKTDMDLSYLQQSIDLATTYQDKIKAQNALFERQKQLKEESIIEERNQSIKQKYGDTAQADYNQWVLGGKKTDGLSAEQLTTYQEIEKMVAEYKSRIDNELSQLDQQKAQQDMQQQLSDWENYLSQRLKIADDYSQKVKEIDLNPDLTEQQKAEQRKGALDVRETQMGNLNKQFGGVSDEQQALAERVVALQSNITIGALTEAETLYKELLDEIGTYIDGIDKSIEDKRLKLADLTDDDASIDAQLASGKKTTYDENGNAQEEALTDADKQALEEQKIQNLNDRLLLEQQINEELAIRSEYETAQTEVQNQQEAITTTRLEEQQRAYDNWEKQFTGKTAKLAQSFNSVSQGVNAVSNIMGNKLSKNGRRALSAISGIANVAKDGVNGLKELVPQITKTFGTVATSAVSAQTATTTTNVAAQTTMTATEVVSSATMAGTATVAAESVKTVEKASVILAIIGLALQITQALVDVLRSAIKTQAESLQESIDAHKERVEELKYQNEQLKRSYKDEVGVDYYKHMTSAIKDEQNAIDEMKDAEDDARAKYDLMVSKYGEDSDKAKEAKKQLQEITEERQNMEDNMADGLKDIADTLLTTDLQSFSQNLADALIDGFENGKEGIEDTWDDTLNSLMRDMMKQQLAMVLMKQFEPVFEEMNKRATDADSLTTEDIAYIQDMMNGAKDSAIAIGEAYYDMMEEMGLNDLEGTDATSGGFQSMSQDTADELNARFTALQIEGANVVTATNAMLDTLTLMQVSTDRQTSLLQNIEIYHQTALAQAEERLDLIRAMNDNIVLITTHTNRLRAIEENTSRL